MPPAVLQQIRNLDAAVWRAATWATPLVFQLLLPVCWSIGWLLSRRLFLADDAFPALVATAAAITMAASFLTGGRLLFTRPARLRGLGLSIAGCGTAVLVIALAFVVFTAIFGEIKVGI